MKNIFKSLILCGLIITLVGCGKNYGKEFKEEYESLNGKKVSSTSELVHRTVSIDENNPFEKISAEEIVKKIEKKETFYLYVGDKMCPWCRSVIEVATKEANDKNISKIYYVNIWDDEHNEVLRDKYEVKEDGSLNKIVDGTEAYHKLLEYFDSVLSNYTLKDNDGNSIETGEKRIYAPNFFYVESGNVKKMVEGISESQSGPFDELTEEMLNDEKKAFDDFFDSSNSCGLGEAC